MPRSVLPPTPAPSTDISGQECPPLSASTESFDLPPPALPPKKTTKQTKPISNYDISLPPPPTRSRTIIQMKPKPPHPQDLARASLQQICKGPAKKFSGPSVPNPSAPSKKSPSSTSAAGKKIARKTAHSVIERRRRSKMNEEFGVLKAMIPACTDQEMHKLAILQASIDYLRYLENCIIELKAANKNMGTPVLQSKPSAPDLGEIKHAQRRYEEIDGHDDEDEDSPMLDPTPTGAEDSFAAYQCKAIARTNPDSVSQSPQLEVQDQPNLHSHSASTSASALPSPAFDPQQYRPKSNHSLSSSSAQSTSLSPMLMPSKEQDQEATTALLMLNQDRRNPRSSRGMSVKDLLSC